MTVVEPNATSFSLSQRYEAESGQILATGIQALVRLPVDLMRADRRAGHRTAAFISGYQGSPLGGYDRELAGQRQLLDALDIVHQPGLNEELAATSVMGSQLSDTFARKRYDGVAGIWYGKAPGLDRASDAIRHGNFAGTARLGGVVALVGDDPAAKSSTLPSRSDPTLAALHVPVLYPGTIQDIIDLGRHGFALSRAAGVWVAMKITPAVADGSGTAMVGPDRVVPVVPTIEIDGKAWSPVLTGEIITPRTLAIEVELFEQRYEMVRRYLAANPVDRFVTNPSDAWLGVVAGGYDAEQVLDALRVLGIDADRLAALGVRFLKLGALHPLNEPAVRELARGAATLLVVEDKLDFLETRLRSALYGTADAPAIVGKRDHDGRPLVAAPSALTLDNLVDVLRRILTLRVPVEQLAPTPVREPARLVLQSDEIRTPFFCSGCPHNTGLQVPEGSLVGAGIGCHGMVSIVPRAKTGTITGLTQMGGEGAQWVGIEPFVEDTHFFQNIGDGTFFHSGQLAIQSSVAAGAHITYKLLYNAAVAMTGGQDAPGLRTPADIARKLLAEGVRQVAITTDDPDKYRDVELPSGVRVAHRDDIVAVQEQLRAVSGVTLLIHDQQCAAEKRRDRKRGILPQAAFRVVIDPRVCEGCGDCGVQSNCLSLHPIETEFGRKTAVDQASCNVDASCLRGDCPAFVTVKPGMGAAKPRATAEVDVAMLPVPVAGRADVTIRMPGIGGTGVVTVSQILAAAAQIAGRPARTVDQTGLSQKAGPVVSTVTIGDPTPGTVDVLLALDVLGAVTPANLAGLDPTRSVAAVSTSIAPTGRMVGKVASSAVDLGPILDEIDLRTMPGRNLTVDASRLVTALLGNAVTANVFMLGVAVQAGFVPLPVADVEQAIDLNGTAVAANLAAFRWGRRWAYDPADVEQRAATIAADPIEPLPVSGFDADGELRTLVSRRAGDLVAFQNRAYADRYVDVVRRADLAERAAGGDGAFTRTVARQLHHVMAYKDEYEVARLLLEGRRNVTQQFGGGAELTWNLHPPMLRAMGLKHKMHLGPWGAPMLASLRSMKRLRGTAMDPFGRAHVRRAERQLVEDYIALVDRMIALLPSDAAKATHVVGLVDQVRGYEGVKMANLERYRAALAAALG